MRNFQYETELQKFRGENRLAQLRSYYFTWKLPKHPSSDTLYELILALISIREDMNIGSNVFGQKYVMTISDLEGKLKGISELNDEDIKIQRHCLAHCTILKEILKEMTKGS